MFAIVAAFIFFLAFVLELLGTSTGDVSLLFLGLLFVALSLAFASGVPWRRG